MAKRASAARFRDEMAAPIPVKSDTQPKGWQGIVLKTNPKGANTECNFANGSSILISNFLASFVHAGDELHFPLELQAANARTEIYIRNTNARERRQDTFQAEIGYATRPKKDKRGNRIVFAEVVCGRLGIAAIHLGCDALRDYFYMGNRRRAWHRQPSLYQLLRVDPQAEPAELRLAFKLRALELRAADASAGDLRALERAFNILAHPELRACYDGLLNDREALALFPYGGFGTLLVAGDRSRDGASFYASRILSFLPEHKSRHMTVPLRKCAFHDDRAVYRDARRKLEITFDKAAMPLPWDSTWNQWKHLLGAKIRVKAGFLASGKYQHHGEAWHLVKREIAVPSHIAATLPVNITEQINEARQTHHRFGQFADALDRIRTRIESAPIEKTDLQKLCAGCGVPGDFDVVLITWKADYDAFYHRQLCQRARRLYLFRSEYIFDLAKAVIVEIPQRGHATYLFSQPATMTEFLATYATVTREHTLQNRDNVAETLGFVGRIIHGRTPQAWLKELKVWLGEGVDCAAAFK